MDAKTTLAANAAGQQQAPTPAQATEMIAQGLAAEKPAAQEQTATTTQASADATAGNADTPAPLTAQRVAEMIAENNKQQQLSAQAIAQRDAFIKNLESGLAKLPTIYQSLLGSDPTKWSGEARQIVARWEADFKASGVKITDVGGVNRDGGTTPARFVPSPTGATISNPIADIARGLVNKVPLA